MSAAVARRLAAINTVATATREAEITEEGPVVTWHVTHANREALAADLRDLAPLGRTDRWQAAVESWAAAVEESTPETFRWAFDQHGVWACYAAE